MPKAMAKKVPIKKQSQKAAAGALPGDQSDRAYLERLVRVNHAGEYGAQRIYAGQIAVLGDTEVGEELRHMAAQEDEHLAAFDAMLTKDQVRPTALQPIWHVAGFLLGAGTALLGREAAMACTVAVEEVIVEHYQNQIDTLATRPLGKQRPELAKLIKKFRDEEAEHRDIGFENDAESAPAYPHLRKLIRKASKTAIWLSERV